MKNKVVIVTGGGRGIGRAICTYFASRGNRMLAASRSPDDLAETKRLVEQEKGICHTHVTDVSKSADVHSLIDYALDSFGRIDVLINCAGVAPLSKIEDLDENIFDAINNVNIHAVYLGCRAVWPTMKEQGEGVIVNFSSVASIDPFPGFGAYGAAKAWVNAWTKGLADEGKEFGIRVFSVAPGAVETRMLRDPFPDFPPDQTLAPAEVAGLTYTLCEPECRHTVGQTIFVRK